MVGAVVGADRPVGPAAWGGAPGQDRGNDMKAWCLAAVLAASLAGCTLPPPVTVASLALDVASFSATGKTVTDHGLSLAFDRDCALLYVLLEGDVCRDPAALAELSPLSDPQPGTTPRGGIMSLEYMADSLSARQVAAAL